mmetsp:Transcript_46182/g.122427  ORF Transcript_46182/g.122427 Transcript_46182/m.122427 type:complete len:81 (-) Transcript_46182:97-339(-)
MPCCDFSFIVTEISRPQNGTPSTFGHLSYPFKKCVCGSIFSGFSTNMASCLGDCSILCEGTDILILRRGVCAFCLSLNLV